MLHKKLLNPSSIAVIGGSDRLDHIGGSVLKNLIDRKYNGDLYVVNPKKEKVQGIRSYHDVAALPQTDLAIIAISADSALPIVKELLKNKGTRGFIVYAAGFSELDKNGARLEHEIARTIKKSGGSLLGPNNIGMINHHFAGVFTRPLPIIDSKGVDFISGSGATAVFTMEAATQIGLTFSNVFSVGNSAQIGVEDILEHLDHTFVPGESSTVKMLYMESVNNPLKLLEHARSLRNKGCMISALKAGVTEKGKAAAASHTGAMVNTDQFVQALFDKAGIIRCNSRYELLYTAAILQITKTKPSRFAIVTHAGGPGVLLTDMLTQNKIEVPDLDEHHKLALSEWLSHGAATKNPIDILATGTAEQLEKVLTYCQKDIDEIDSIAVIFGSPGLGSVKEAYTVIHNQIQKRGKPIFPLFPSVVNAKEEIESFIEKGHLAFYDETLFGLCISRIDVASVPEPEIPSGMVRNFPKIRSLVDRASKGFLDTEQAFELLTLSGISVPKQAFVSSALQLFDAVSNLSYPVVQKTVGPGHKTDAGGVILHIQNTEQLQQHFKILMDKTKSEGVLVQEMIRGKEVFIGAKYEEGFPTLLLCGAGGTYIEALGDRQFALVPIGPKEAGDMVKKLKMYPVLKGMRGDPPCKMEAFHKAIVNISWLLQLVPEIVELDINPLIINKDSITAVDVRICISK